MASKKDVVQERASQAEEEYFRRHERELQERLRERAAKESARRDLAAASGVADESVLAALEELGFDRETVAVLHLFPLVAVAWADGELQPAERAQIIAAARAQGIAEGSGADRHLAEWLASPPSATYTEHAMKIARDVAAASGEKVPPGDLLALCHAVASASGGFLGLGNKVSAAEDEALKRVAAMLGGKSAGRV